MSSEAYPIAVDIDRPPLAYDDLIQRKKELADAFFGITAHPPGESEDLRAFGIAALECATQPDKYPQFDQLTTSLIESRQDLRIVHQAQLLRIGFMYVLRKIDPDYYLESKSPDLWHDRFTTILNDQYLRGELEDNIWSNDNQANDPKRYAGPKLAILAHAKQLPESLSLVDSGCSAGLGQIQLGENLPFSKIRFATARDYARLLLHNMLQQPLSVGKNVGFDRKVVKDINWVEACSYYPHEYGDKDKMEQRTALYKMRDDFKIIYGDVTDGPANVGLNDVREQFSDGQATVSMAITSLYLSAPNHSDKAINNLEDLATDLTIVQDVAEIDPNDPTKLVFAEDIYGPRAHYNLFSKDVSKPGQPFEHLGRWANFRCHTFSPTRALVDRLLRQL